MTRLRPLSIDEAPEAARPLMEAAAGATGRVGASVGIQARCPAILEASRTLSAGKKQHPAGRAAFARLPAGGADRHLPVLN